ncbi:HAMP domain-containing protein [Paenibacillus albiflavus]|uniref:HAMP domain-containing protein n=1 Tax=Paenibacillus albiflavus TaxID=2545760 RepID=A0A4R4EBF8_9BACL|nr:histidine kinase [Paenibacillus albiflavus]TCZ77224.1 HAMP domain-containing protein [Paenibacillus albiflavus]
MKALVGKLSNSSFQVKLLLSYSIIILIPVLSALLLSGFKFYYQTKGKYEDFLEQLNTRTNVTVNDFISNIARNSYFYLTDTRLQTILNKNYQQENLELLEDANYMMRAMDQIVLMNGYIAGVTVIAPNNRIYNSTSAYTWDLEPIIERVTKQALQKGKIIVSSPYASSSMNGNPKLLSIVRYLSDLNLKNNMEGYVKVDIHYKSFRNLIDGISDSNLQLTTVVMADGKMIYPANDSPNASNDAEWQQLLSQIESKKNTGEKIVQFRMKDETYLFASTVNETTNWNIIQYIPLHVVEDNFLNNTHNYLILSLLTLIIAFFLALFFSRRFIKPIHKLRKAMKRVDSGNMDQVVLNIRMTDEIGQLIDSYNAMILRLKQSREMEILSNRLQKRAELNMLQAQINPHFLYNTLNVIHSIAELNRLNEISVMAKSLASLYRYNIKNNDDVTIEKELEQIKNYINIQQIRFLSKFNVIYEIDTELYPYKILKFLLQPLVENAFYHGLEPKGGKGTLRLSITKRGHSLHICIEDDGVGISEQKLAELNAIFEHPFQVDAIDTKVNFGLRNVHARIKNFYGDEYWIRVSSTPHLGTCFEIKIPAEKEHDDEHSGR